MNAPIVVALLREYHRRLTHFRARTLDLVGTARWAQQQGELLGLRGALGIALGGAVEGSTADQLASERYAQWRTTPEAAAAACRCRRCTEPQPTVTSTGFHEDSL